MKKNMKSVVGGEGKWKGGNKERRKKQREERLKGGRWNGRRKE